VSAKAAPALRVRERRVMFMVFMRVLLPLDSRINNPSFFDK
jgi:hypothetical protein